MQVKFRQTTRNGCGSLSIANIFDDHRFSLGLEDCPGEPYALLNRKLQEFGYEIFIDGLFLTSKWFTNGNRLKKGQCEMFRYSNRMTNKIRKSTVVPYLFSIANSKGRNQHMVAVFHNLSDGLFHVVDSTKEEVMIFNLVDLLARFHIVSVALFRMWDNPEPGNFVTLDKSEMSHVFTLHL